MHKFLGLTFFLSVIRVNGMSLLALPSLYPIVIPAEYETPYREGLNSSIEYVFLYSVSFLIAIFFKIMFQTKSENNLHQILTIM